jgi:hypothetical protein
LAVRGQIVNALIHNARQLIVFPQDFVLLTARAAKRSSDDRCGDEKLGKSTNSPPVYHLLLLLYSIAVKAMATAALLLNLGYSLFVEDEFVVARDNQSVYLLAMSDAHFLCSLKQFRGLERAVGIAVLHMRDAVRFDAFTLV